MSEATLMCNHFEADAIRHLIEECDPLVNIRKAPKKKGHGKSK